MSTSLRELGDYVRAAREDAAVTQDALAQTIGGPVNRTAIALLEQGRRLPPDDALEAICGHFQVPTRFWKPLLSRDVRERSEFEDALSELAGRWVSLRGHDQHTADVAHGAVLALFNTGQTREQLYARFCAALVYYDVPRPTHGFFTRYLDTAAFQSVDAFRHQVRMYQKEAIRLFSSFTEAYAEMATCLELAPVLAPLQVRDDAGYRARAPWEDIEEIPPESLPDLGYISARRVRQEQSERDYLAGFLDELAEAIDLKGKNAVGNYSEKKRRKIGSLLRKFDSAISHDLNSPLFAPDPDQLRREGRRLAPKGAADLARMEETQTAGLRNLSRYLAADFMDVYVATSMRSDADFASVNDFVSRLFSLPSVHPLKLRYFNPTQSWIEDRVAKGLVEALMLRRADFTIYMAQKSDTFGKDSEASVALGQGKPVIVYVPRLFVRGTSVDSENMGLLARSELQRLVESEASGEDAEVDETTDQQALLSQLLKIRLDSCTDAQLVSAARDHWADFDLYGESARIQDEKQRAAYRAWLDEVITKAKETAPASIVRGHLIGVLVATATNFEKRATVFREIHPLALQVILSSGVLNGILVVRSIDACGAVLHRLVQNNLELDLEVDDANYRLVERLTRSTIRVISQHTQLSNAFDAFYRRGSE